MLFKMNTTKSKSKILFLIPSLVGGGAERTLVNILNHLNKEKKDVSAHGNLYCRDEAIFKIEDRLIYINVSKSEEEIIEELKCKI